VKFGPLIKKNSCPDIDKNFEEEIDARKDMKESKRLKTKKKQKNKKSKKKKISENFIVAF